MHEPISAIHPSAIEQEKNELIAAAIKAAFAEGRGWETHDGGETATPEPDAG